MLLVSGEADAHQADLLLKRKQESAHRQRRSLPVLLSDAEVWPHEGESIILAGATCPRAFCKFTYIQLNAYVNLNRSGGLIRRACRARH